MKNNKNIGAVLDASSLIIVAKLQEISTLYQVFGILGIPSAVYRETVVAVKQRGKDDVLVIEAAIRSGFIEPITLTPGQNRFVETLHTSGGLGLGECEALAYANDTGIRLIIEERKGRAVARAHSITYTVLQVFPLEGYIQGKISFEQCVAILERIAVAMNTDLAILTALKMAAKTIRREREARND
ncbi:MAG: hypothetical protein ISS57_19345 [Anaerolineales bacterium]|nr:hypothetical protein [Anaerolineales bacterium]